MTLRSAKEEAKLSDELWNAEPAKSLREQQEEDFGYWGPYEFKMSQGEGAWDSVTTTSPKELANKMIGLLSNSQLQLFIDVDEDTRKKRKSISNTEQLANGIIWLNDREGTSVPSKKGIQDSLSTFAVLRGGICQSLYWYEEDKKPRCESKIYDPLTCQWIEGDGELLWFCHRDYVTRHYIDKHFKDQKKKGFNFGNADVYGRILMRTFWDDEYWKVAINGEWVDEGYHGLGYLPVNINSCGAVPYLNSEDYQNTAKWSWMSYAMNTRKLYKLESKLLSIEATKALDSGRKDFLAAYDSIKGGSDTPDIKKLAYGSGQRNNVLFLDRAKGHEFIGFVEAPGNEVADAFYSRVSSMIVGATIHPIAFGEMKQSSGSGTMVAELRSAALEFLSPFKKCVENGFIWLAEESVRQFKKGEFNKVEVEGKDRKQEKFYIGLEPKDVEEKHFDCELVIDRLRDEIQELGAAIQSIQSGLTSRRTARLKHNIVQDPDKEEDLIEMERHKALSATDPVYHNYEMAKHYHDQGNEEMELHHIILVQKALESEMMQIVKGENIVPEQPKEQPVITPQMQTARIAAEPRMGG